MLFKNFKDSLEFKIENEGEFWVCFEDFYMHFNSIQLCHLTPGKIDIKIFNFFCKNNFFLIK